MSIISIYLFIFISPIIGTNSFITISTISTTRTNILLPIQSSSKSILAPPLNINEDFCGLHRINKEPDVYIIENFLDKEACFDMIINAKEKKLQASPVAYAGWTTDSKELLSLAAKGPVSWLAILLGWIQTKDDNSATIFEFLKHSLLWYPVIYGIAAIGITAYINFRTNELKSMRTSTSTTLNNLDNPNSGATKFVKRAAQLFDRYQQNTTSQIRREASYFEAPTIIRYENGQVLKPHFDANREG